MDLRNLFTTVPILVNPDPSRQFVVELGASDLGTGAVPFIPNHELLAVVRALQEGRRNMIVYFFN